MTRLVLIFSATFALGALIAVVLRTSHHQPYAMVESAPAPSEQPQVATAASAPTTETVNTICAICGMPVNPKLGTALYQEKRIGFGCKACPAEFAAHPEKFGPSALKNVVAE